MCYPFQNCKSLNVSVVLLCTIQGHLLPNLEPITAGLTWLMWPESCPPNGGILADEMEYTETLSDLFSNADGN
ncbi:hypothetical protein DICVIV_06108 [Dictyocaulus viviparus]|uniref:Uncharacterized protein n=1 Tax=Dictyocaulus viviparus TaxID=29172 RepID=A0A0D8XZR4_DICVI|nr:hypothetical protein DICVIV_06108 [Dictyocaulus viviparus]